MNDTHLGLELVASTSQPGRQSPDGAAPELGHGLGERSDWRGNARGIVNKAAG